MLDEDFDKGTLDPGVWFPYYLPHWSSRADSAATLQVHDSVLHLSIPADQPLWCPDRHREPLRVSCIQSGSFSGPVGSTVGQQPFAEDLTVREEQPTLRGYTPHFAHVEVRMRALLSRRSMFSLWMATVGSSTGSSSDWSAKSVGKSPISYWSIKRVSLISAHIRLVWR